MEFPRKQPPTVDPFVDDLEFQVMDWFIPENDRSKQMIQRITGDYNWEEEPSVYTINMYGVTAEGHTVFAKVSGFEPYFFVKPPPSWGNKIRSKVGELRMTLLEGTTINKKTGATRYIIPKRLRDHLVYVKTVMKKDFWGFTNGEDFPFIKIKVKSLALFNSLKYYFMGRSQEGFKLYESNIDPFLRFIHERDIRPCGWVTLKKETYDVLSSGDDNEEGLARTAICVEVSYTDVHPNHDINKIAPLLIASFDLECASSHGDFPVANKTYLKLAMDLVEAAYGMSMEEVVTEEDVRGWILHAFTGKPMDTPHGVTIHHVYPRSKKITVGHIEKILNKEGLMAELYRLVMLEVKERKIRRKEAVRQDDDDDEESFNTEENEVDKLLTKCMPPLEGDAVIQIGTTVNRYGSDEIIYKHIITLKSCDADECQGIVVESYDTEEEVIQAWKEFLDRLDPDILTGYNIFGFDYDYIWTRAKQLGIEEAFSQGFGRLRNRQSMLIEQKLSSSALGDNILKYIDGDGVVTIDMLKVMQRDHKLDKYSLDHVANVFLGDRKNDLSPKELFARFRGDAKDRAVIARYCVQDCALVNRLIHKLKVLENNIGMGNVCSVPLSYLFMRGQGVKIFSLVAKECREKDYLIPVLRNFNDQLIEDEEGYEGAIVLEPKEGIYLEDPVTVLDYSSLYPSSMIERNLSHDCYVMDEQYAHLEDKGISYITVKYDIYEGMGDKKTKVGEKACTFAQLPNGEKGIIPSILMKLLQQRKNTRKKIEYEKIYLRDGRIGIGLVKEMAETGELEILNVDKANLGAGFGGHKAIVSIEDIVNREPAFNSFEQAVLNALQLAYKITANSLYGQCGARTSPIYMKEVAASTTATGRERIMMATKFAKEKYDAEIIYGDSVSGDTPLLIRYPNGVIDIKTIEMLSDRWSDYDNFRPWDDRLTEKEQALFDGEIWTNGKWAKIIRVIRHKCNKKMYRVNTFRGCVDVTEDHSLIGIDEQEVKPSDCVVDETKIKHTYPSMFSTKEMLLPRPITNDEAWVMGFFFADGSCGNYMDTCDKISWAINNQNLDFLHTAMDYLHKIEPKDVVTFKILDTLESSGVYKLVACGSIYYMVTKYRALFYDKDKYKKVPSIILNANEETRKAFLQGYLTGDGGKDDMERMHASFACKGKIGAAGLYYIVRSLGYDKVRVNICEAKPNTYWIRTLVDENYFEENKDKVMKLHEIGDSSELQYVYDIETTEGRFGGGVGEITLVNTDSCFLSFKVFDENGVKLKNKEALAASIKMGQKMSQEIKAIMPPPQSLEYEKTLWPFILFSKKRYVGHLYEDDPNKKPKVKSMGIVIVRRDNANILKKVFGGIIDIILNQHDIPASITFLKNQLEEMVKGNIPLEELIITKTLKASYKNPKTIAHKVLADRISLRDPGNKPQSNDRIPFVFIRPPSHVEVKLQGDRIEHPDYIREHGLVPDYRYYITNQLVTPICQLYALCLEQIPNYPYDPSYWEQMDVELSYKEQYQDPKKRKVRITTLKMRCAEELLFEPYYRQLGEDIMKMAKKAAKPAKIKILPKLGAHEIAPDAPLVQIIATDNKKTKSYDLAITVIHQEEVKHEWKESVLKKKSVTTKQSVYIRAAEMAFERLKEVQMGDEGVRIQVGCKDFLRSWKKVIAQADGLSDRIEAVIKENDIGAMNEVRSMMLFLNLVDASETIPYCLDMIPTTL